MHGVIFTSFRDYVTAAHGEAVCEAALADEPVYLLSEAYDDARLRAVAARTSALTGIDPDTVVHDFGVFTAETTFTRLYPACGSSASSCAG